MTSTFDLGGPGPRCSMMQVRRFLAGELESPERERLAEHLEGCERCQASEREIRAERAALVAALPFPVLAAGVAERLARSATGQAERSRDRSVFLVARYGSVALAASLLVMGGWLAWQFKLDTARERLLAGSTDRLGATRIKGGARAMLYAQTGAGTRLLGPGERVPSGAKLLVSLEPAGRGFAAVAIVDGDGVSPLYAGPARPGPLPQGFLWTGSGSGRIVIDYADRPIDRDRFVQRLADRSRVPGGTERVTLELSR